MKRLREVEETTPVVARARALLDAVEPLPESAARMRRVRLALDHARGASAPLRRAPALVLAGALALFGASAFAAVRLFVATREAPVLEVEKAPAPPKAHRAPARAEAPEKPAPEQALAVEVAPDEERERPPTRKARAVSTKGAADDADDAAEAVDPGSALVHEAVKALRRDHDPARAARLLAEHRAQTPAGPLAEEALALQIEAALALHDARAAQFAREYLAHHPNGRYRRIAERALADAPP